MLVGAVHWLSFCAAKRAAMKALTPAVTVVHTVGRPGASLVEEGPVPVASTSGRDAPESDSNSSGAGQQRSKGRKKGSAASPAIASLTLITGVEPVY